MLVDIDKIIVGDRIRKDFGDIAELADDIRENGLINPPTVNKDYVLLAGERRLRACKSLGWTQIEVHMLDTRDEAHDLAVEMSENNLRRNFTGSELAEGIRRQMEIEAAKAKERQGGRTDIGETFPRGSSGRARDKAGEAFGISGKQAEKVLYVADNSDLLDPSDFADWDEGKLSTNKAFQRIKAAQEKAERDRKLAEMERDQAKSDLAEAYRSAELAETEIESLKRQVAAKPQPEVVEREVVREVPPADYEDTKRKVQNLQREADRLNREYQRMRQAKQEADKRLEQANELLGEKGRADNAQRDIEQLTAATNAYLRQYGGKAWAFDQFYRVDETAQQEFIKAINNMLAFAQNLSAMVADRKQIGEN